MRRPVFNRWIKRACIEIADAERFNLRAFAAQAQQDKTNEEDCGILAASLHLYSLTNDCNDKLRGLVWRDDVIAVYNRAEEVFGGRSIEALALRGTPMRLLPASYRDILQGFHHAYHAPERKAEAKRDLCEQAQLLHLKTACPLRDITEATGIAEPNLSDFLRHAKVEKLTLQGAQSVLAYLESRHASLPEN